VQPPTTKRLNLIDAMVLVAATATGFALGRMVVSEAYGGRVHFINDLVAVYAISVALTWSLAILALNLTRYLATRRELACRPGFSAVVAIVIERASETIYYAIVEGIGPSGNLSMWLLERFWHLLSLNVMNVVRSGSSAGVVTAVWLVTATANCWRPEKSWIDRTGRVLGVFWLLAAFAYWLSLWAFPVPGLRPPILPPDIPPE
jgi:hypothetical protein